MASAVQSKLLLLLLLLLLRPPLLLRASQLGASQCPRLPVLRLCDDKLQLGEPAERRGASLRCWLCCFVVCRRTAIDALQHKQSSISNQVGKGWMRLSLML